jgi:tetratricopeptide (TPR) repeat protein
VSELHLPQRGRLSVVPMPWLLFELARARFSGALALERPGARKRLLLAQGFPVAADSSLASESLASHLVDEGRISAEDSARLAEQLQKKPGSEAAAVLALQILAPKLLFVSLQSLLRRRVVECFRWPDGEFSLDAAAAPPPDAQAFRCDPYGLIQDGIAGHWSAERVLASLGAKLSRFPRRGEGFDAALARLRRDAGVDRLVASLEAGHALGVALQRAASPAALAAAWLLDADGALELREEAARPGGDEAAAAPAPAPDVPEIEIVVAGAAGASAPDTAAGGAAPGAAARGASPEAEKLRREVLDRHARLDALDHYTLLGVDANASPAVIKRAYFALAKRFHPDALARLGLDDVRAHANDVFARIAKAHEVLSDPQERQRYDESRRAGGGELDANRLAQAEMLYRKAEIVMRTGNFTGALEFLRPAVELWPEEPAYQAAYGWALYKQAAPDPKAARGPLETAVELSPDDAVTWFRLGVVLRALGEAQAAESAIARARQLDPKVR